MSTAVQLPTHPIQTGAVRHVKVTGAAGALGFEPCEDFGCSVGAEGTTSSCGRVACPACGCSGTNLTTVDLVDAFAGARLRCTCGYSWMRARRSF
jgi:hypothetical protein